MNEPLRLPEGLSARIATPADTARIVDLAAACQRASDRGYDVHENDVVEAFALGGDGGVIVVAAADGALVAWANLEGERAGIEVHPAWRGRGIGTALLGWSEARARSTGAARVRQTIPDTDQAAQALLAANGYATTWTSWVLEAPLGAERPRVVVPPGIEIRPYVPADAFAVYRVIEDAFNEWPGRQPATFEVWSAYILEHASFAPALSRLAIDGDEIVGVAVAFDFPGTAEGWVQQLATRATHRHRGIARALLQASFAAFHDAGQRMICLSTDSRTGALTLYERLGMRIRRSYTGWAKNLG
jgi:GNAT superfamily N-acetyltransferase